MKSLTDLARCILLDCSIRCSADTQRDYQTVISRVKDEGVSFLTITLADFGSSFDLGLETGKLDLRRFRSFKRASATASIPAFLQGMMCLVFDRDTGKLLDNPNHEAILCIRQFCLMWKKISLPCSDARVRASLRSYVKCDSELDEHFKGISSNDLSDFRKVAALLWGDVLNKVGMDIINHNLPLRHGPGATAEKLSRHKRYDFPTWHRRLEEHFPMSEYALFNYAYADGSAFELTEPDQEQPVRVVTVPKTLKTPRVIAIEPSCVQFAQQGLMTRLVESIEQDELVGGFVNFTDQSINQAQAKINSLSRKHATMDLSEASDRVHNTLVKLLFASNLYVSEAVQACRSTRAELPTGQIIDLKKFASMGSATCFPVEAMVFFTIMVLAEIRERYSASITRGNVDCAVRRSTILVYGDDLIVPTYSARATADLLEAFGLKVNRKKTFSRGYFRETCGEEYYAGTRVTPTYVRAVFPSKGSQSSSDWWSLVATCNQLYFSGFWNATRYMRTAIESKLGRLPHVDRQSSSMGWHSVDNRYTVSRWSPQLHKWLVKTWQLKTKKQHDPLSDNAALMKWALSPNRKGDKDHYTKTVRRGDVTKYRRWNSPY